MELSETAKPDVENSINPESETESEELSLDQVSEAEENVTETVSDENDSNNS